MKLGMDEVLKVPYKCCYFSARSVQGRIQGGAKIGHGGGGSPSSGNFFFRPERVKGEGCTSACICRGTHSHS